MTPELARRRGDLAEWAVGVAAELGRMVREEDSDAIGGYLRGLPLDEEHIVALLIVQAGMAAVDRMSLQDMLGWVTWDERGRPLGTEPYRRPRPSGVKPEPRQLEPCGTYAAWRRHKKNNEPIDQACAAASSAFWAGVNAARRPPRRATVIVTEENADAAA